MVGIYPATTCTAAVPGACCSLICGRGMGFSTFIPRRTGVATDAQSHVTHQLFSSFVLAVKQLLPIFRFPIWRREQLQFGRRITMATDKEPPLKAASLPPEAPRRTRMEGILSNAWPCLTWDITRSEWDILLLSTAIKVLLFPS